MLKANCRCKGSKGFVLLNLTLIAISGLCQKINSYEQSAEKISDVLCCTCCLCL